MEYLELLQRAAPKMRAWGEPYIEDALKHPTYYQWPWHTLLYAAGETKLYDLSLIEEAAHGRPFRLETEQGRWDGVHAHFSLEREGLVLSHSDKNVQLPVDFLGVTSQFYVDDYTLVVVTFQ